MTRAEAVELAVRRHARTRWVGETEWYELAITRETDMEYTVKAIRAHFRVICNTYGVPPDNHILYTQVRGQVVREIEHGWPLGEPRHQHYDGASLRI